jgi:hypothetical protein
MSGDQLRVLADGAVVWEGSVCRDALHLDGPVGIRTDNARLQFELLTGELSRTHPESVIACKVEASE